jgi:hypothetical protein
MSLQIERPLSHTTQAWRVGGISVPTGGLALTGSDVAVDLLVRLCSDATITPVMVKEGQALASRVAETAALSFMRQVRAPAPAERVVPLQASRTRPARRLRRWRALTLQPASFCAASCRRSTDALAVTRRSYPLRAHHLGSTPILRRTRSPMSCGSWTSSTTHGAREAGPDRIGS